MKKAWDKWGKTSKLAKLIDKDKYAADVIAKDKDDADKKSDRDTVAAKDDETAQQQYDRSYEKHGDNAKVPAGYEKDVEDPEKIVPKGTDKKNKKKAKKQVKQDKKDMGSDKVTPAYKQKIKDRQQKDKVSNMPKSAADVKNSKEGVEMTEPNIEEAYFKVDIAGMPSIYIEGGGEGTVKKSLRGIVKNDAIKTMKVVKVKKSEMLKTFKADMKEEAAELNEKGTAYPATIKTLKMIVKDKQNQVVMFKSGQARVDSFTASAMVQVYDALKPKSKKTFEKMIGDKAGFMKTQAFAMKMTEETFTGFVENVDGEFVKLKESNELQAIMALDDAGIEAEINRKGEVSVKKRDLKKAVKALSKSFKRGKEPKVVAEQRSAYDVVSKARTKLTEAYDVHAADELRMYIDNDRQLYRQQTTSIIKNVQRKLKSGKYDHTKAPKLWSYLVDNGVKKYIKEFGGNAKDLFPKDVRQSVAIELANYYKAEIEAQGGEMM